MSVKYGRFIWQRKPWRSPGGTPTWRKAPECERWRHPSILLGNWLGWLRYAHDCQDPRLGCSCTGGYRFPRGEKPWTHGQ